MADSTEKKTVRDFVARLNAGMDALPLLTESVVVTINGTTPLSGRFAGIELVRGILLDSARVVIESLSVEIAELIAKGSRVAALLKLSGRSTKGVAFNEDGRLCSCVFTVAAGRIEEIALFADTSLIEIALYGRRYVPDV